MATITDQGGLVLATVDVETGAFEWVNRAAAPEGFADLIDQPWLPERTGGFDVATGILWDGLLERPRLTPEWAALVCARVFNASPDLEWRED